MFATTNVNIRMDARDKAAFENIVNQLGVSMSTAFNMFAKAVVREERIPFAVTLKKDEAYDPEYAAALNKSIEQVKKGEVYTFSSVEELDKFANAC